MYFAFPARRTLGEGAHVWNWHDIQELDELEWRRSQIEMSVREMSRSRENNLNSKSKLDSGHLRFSHSASTSTLRSTDVRAPVQTEEHLLRRSLIFVFSGGGDGDPDIGANWNIAVIEDTKAGEESGH